MPMMIFVNLPVADVAKSTAFYEAIGATKNPMFSDETASCMVFSDTIHVMIMNHEKFQSFTPKAIPDSKTSNEVLLCYSVDTRAEVDATLDKAIKAGGRPDISPADEYPFMYGRNFEDLDGHVWQAMWMDMNAFQEATGAQAAEPA